MISNLEYYRVFYYVAKTGSVTKAAGELSISQPAVSQALRQLEGNLGVLLFTRAARASRGGSETISDNGVGDGMIRNIIFDIGNVLTDFRWRDFLRDKGFDEGMIDRIAKASVESPVWREFDRGSWSDEELFQAFVDNDPEIAEELHLAFDDIHGMVTPREYAVPWVKRLKDNGYQVYYLSNFAGKAHRECADALEFIAHTDGGILSYQDKMIKPDPAIYRLLLSRYELKAEECVFLDDLPVNVEAAEREGMHGIVFETMEQAEEELQKLEVQT